MPGSRFEIRFDRKPWGFLLVSLALLTVPVTWLIAWSISVIVHELGHLLAARFLSVPVWSMTIGPLGARIETGYMEPVQELLCSIAGPLAGSLLMLAGPWIPLTAMFAFFHTMWNLIPAGDLDGARVLRCLIQLVRKIPCKPG